MHAQAGFYVDAAHLHEQDVKAQLDLKNAENRFRAWLRRYADRIGGDNVDTTVTPDEIPDLVNLSSSAQIQTLLFGGFESTKEVEKKPTKAEAEAGVACSNVKPRIEPVRSPRTPDRSC